MKQQTQAYVRSTGAYVPPRRMSNDELAQIVDTSDEWIYSHTGIRYRHIADQGVAASDLAVEAARAALQGAGVEAGQIDLILLATSTPDYPGLPATACIVQDRLEAVNAAAMDLVAACTGFVYGLQTARAFIESGSADTVLLIGSEVYSQIINWKDRNSCVLFGDGAGAAVIAAGQTAAGSRIIDGALYSRGQGAEALARLTGGSRNPLAADQPTTPGCYLSMDGRRVYNFAVAAIVETIQTLLQRNGLSFDDIDWVVPHQANVRIIDAAARRAGFDPARFYTNIAEYANTSAASIPIALDEMSRNGAIARGQTVITVGFGSGLTYGGNLIVW
ncbi:MAG: ketoacyl-ACP synthase III [Spirochaetaceae bacterium]|nr:MAG: ketoacyl-ACP synthase III [Spirochaetaceae bacterium]